MPALTTIALAGLATSAVAGEVSGKGWDWGAGKAIKDTFSPEMPEAPEAPDPVAQQSALPAAQAEERSLINRAGLQTTKKVQRSLLRQSGRQTLGGTSV